jgi:hypothetical protein
MVIRPATPQLLDLAEAVRGTRWRDELAPALLSARAAGWDWPRTLLEVARLLVAEDASPGDLAAAARRPLPRVTVAPEVAARGAAQAREALQAGR